MIFPPQRRYGRVVGDFRQRNNHHLRQGWRACQRHQWGMADRRLAPVCQVRYHRRRLAIGEAAMDKITVPYGTGDYQFGELYLPETQGAHAVVVLIHGGYWRAFYGLDLMYGLAEDLAQRGIAAWNIEYRRVGNAGGGWPGTFLDVARATEHLRKLAAPY